MVGWEADGHRLEFYTFGEALAPSTRTAAAAAKADSTRIGEALSELRTRFAGRDLGAVIVISDGIDTGRIGHGPVEADTRGTLEAMGAPVHTVLVGEKELRDLSVATVLADDFAFVRTPIKLVATLRHSGYGGRAVDVSLLCDGRLLDVKAVRLSDKRVQETVSFDLTPDQPGSYVFEIKTPVLVGEALESNNSQVFTLKVIRDRVRVLHVCGRPSWNERFLRSMLRLDPNMDLVSFFILRTDTDEMWPLAVAEVGRGRTLALLTDSAWSWGFGAAGVPAGFGPAHPAPAPRGFAAPFTGDDGRTFQRFWEGAIRWLVRDPALSLLRIELDKLEYRRGQTVSARVRTLRTDYTSAPGVEVALELRAAESGEGVAALRSVKVKTGGDGEGQVELADLAAGAYRLAGRARLDGRVAEEGATFVIRAEGQELYDVVAREEVLRELASASGGDFRKDTLGNPRIKPPRKVRVGSLRTVEVWSSPLLLLLAVALLAAEWTLRRRSGHA